VVVVMAAMPVMVVAVMMVVVFGHSSEPINARALRRGPC
jgi:hypothetical protein